MNVRVALVVAAAFATTVSSTLRAAPTTRPAGEGVDVSLLPAPPVDPNLAPIAPAGFRPFTVDHHGRVDSAADVSFLLKAPAGKDGFITVRDGHLVYPNGERFRIWGVN